MAIKLYGSPLSNNAVRAMAVLNELGLDYEFCPVDLATGAHKKPDFLALNPFGQIPALQDSDVTIFESRAITRYIATKYKETGKDIVPACSAQFEVWLQVEASQFNAPIYQVCFELLFKPLFGMTTDNANIETQSEKLTKVLDIYEAHLSKNKYLAGDEFTLADLNHMPELHLISKTAKGDLVNSRPHVKAWWEDISARPAWKKTVSASALPA